MNSDEDLRGVKTKHMGSNNREQEGEHQLQQLNPALT